MRTGQTSANAPPSGAPRRGKTKLLPFLKKGKFRRSPTKWFRSFFSVSRQCLSRFKEKTLRVIGLTMISIGRFLFNANCFDWKKFKRTIFELLNSRNKELFKRDYLISANKKIQSSVREFKAHGVLWARRLGLYQTHNLEWVGDLPRDDINLFTVSQDLTKEMITDDLESVIDRHLDHVVDFVRQYRSPQYQTLRRAVFIGEQVKDAIYQESVTHDHDYLKGIVDWCTDELGHKRTLSELYPYALRHRGVDGEVFDEMRRMLKYFSTEYKPSNPYDIDEDPLEREFLNDLLDRYDY